MQEVDPEIVKAYKEKLEYGTRCHEEGFKAGMEAMRKLDTKRMAESIKLAHALKKIFNMKHSPGEDIDQAKSMQEIARLALIESRYLEEDNGHRLRGK